MTVATENAYAERSYTGVETSLTPGFGALSATDIYVGYLDPDGLPIALTQGVHFSVSLGTDNAVKVTPIAFPNATPVSPVVITIERITPALQGVDFVNLNSYDPSVHGSIADAGAYRDAELRSKLSRSSLPAAASASALDFRPRRLKAADPLSPEDLATKAYVDEKTGTDAQVGAEAARDIALSAAAVVSAGAIAVAGYVAAAQTSASILGNPDYGFYTETITAERDYGTYL